MSDRLEEMEARVHETPLADRLEKCRVIVGKLCSDGRPPKMTIPVQWDDEDFFMSVTMKDAITAIKRVEELIKLVREVKISEKEILV